jgi:hypothetical protein
MAQIAGIRATSQAITETRLVRYVNEDAVLLEPEVTPLITFLLKLGGRYVPCDSPRIEYFEDDYVARWAVNGSGAVSASASSTTVNVTDGTLFQPGDIFIVPQAVGVTTAPEMIRVTAVSTNALTVVRNVGSTGLVTIAADADLAILGTAFEEGATPPTAKTTQTSAGISYTQIFRKTLNLSKTQVASKVYSAPKGERAFQHAKLIKQMKVDMNRQFLFGVKSESLTGGPNGEPIRTTQGLNSVISTNTTDGATTLTETKFETFARQAFRYGKSTKLLLAAPMIISAIHSWGNAKLQLKPLEKIYGVNITRIMTGHGEWLLARDWMLEDATTTNGFAGWAFSVDLDEIKMHYLSGNGENRNFQVHQDVIQDGRDAYVDEALAEVGICIRHEKKHAKLYNVTAYS